MITLKIILKRFYIKFGIKSETFTQDEGEELFKI